MYRGAFVLYWLLANVACEKAAQAGGVEGHQHQQQQSPGPGSRGAHGHSHGPGELLSSPRHDSAFDACTYDDFACLSMAASDKLGLDAIKLLHKQLDDDEDGNVDYSESDDFLKEELKYDSGAERRQKAFHRDNDMHVSVKELWEAWLRSEVHNWTVEQTSDWLAHHVDLPQYAPNFVLHRVTGANLPRLAVNNANYLAVLGIKDPIHKQKISLKAMDVVLFGPPKDGFTWKDVTLVLLLAVGLLGSYYAYRQNKKFKHDLSRMNRDMDSLQNAERALEHLQKELEEANQVRETAISEKISLEKRLQDSGRAAEGADGPTSAGSYSDLEVSQLKAEIEMLRTELQIAEGELKDRCWAAPASLQQWLQLTHEVENRAYLKKRVAAERQLQQAREACEKLRKKRSSLVGAFVSTHGKSIDEVDRSIVEARTALNEVTHELQERVHRWKQIELICGFPIVNNTGLQSLENALYRSADAGSRILTHRGRVSSADDLDDDAASLYATHGGAGAGPQAEGDSSGSEASSRLEEETAGARPAVQFVLGDGEEQPVVGAGKVGGRLGPGLKSASQSNMAARPAPPLDAMARSLSHDAALAAPRPTPPAAPPAPRHPPIHEQAPPEDDVCSTDSSVVDDSDAKKKRRKLFNFSSKKGKTRAD